MTALFACAPDAPFGETVDMVKGAYVGGLEDAQLENRITLIDPDSSLTVRFSDDEGILVGDITFNGEIKIGLPLGVSYTLTGPETDTVEGVTVEDEHLWCVYDASVKLLEVSGEFEEGGSVLRLDVEKIGILPLQRVEPVPVDTEEEDSGG